jgi:hypothetical protein
MTKQLDLEGKFVTVIAAIAFLSFNGVVLAGLFKILAET